MKMLLVLYIKKYGSLHIQDRFNKKGKMSSKISLLKLKLYNALGLIKHIR